MKKFLRIQSEIFGLDIGDSSIKIAKFKQTKKGYSLVSFNQIELSPGIVGSGVIKKESDLAEQIKKACKSVKGQNLKTKYVTLSLPEERSFLQTIQMPDLPEKDLKSAAIFEVENYIPLPVEEIYVDFQKISSDSKTNTCQILLVAMPKKIVDSYASCLERAGLIPFSFEVESLSIARSSIKDGMPTAIVNFGKNRSSFVVFSAGSVRFSSSISVGSGKITKNISEELGVSREKAEQLKVNEGLKNGQVLKSAEPVLEDLAEQIKKYLNFYKDHFFHSGPEAEGKIEKIIFCGGGAGLAGLPEFFIKKLHVVSEVADFGHIKLNIKGLESKSFLSFTAAFGLAERGVIEGKEYPHI